MDLFTRCSNCDTVFRVTTRHLQASGGQVRCGRCEAVFDAFASLTAMPPGEDRVVQDTGESRTAGGRVAASTATTGLQDETVEFAAELAARSATETASAEAGAVTTGPDEAAPSDTEPAKTAATESGLEEDGEEGHELQSGPAAAVENAGPAALDAAASLYEWEFKPAPKLAGNRLWLSLSLLMLVVALAQAGYVFRTEILVNLPEAKPVYQQVCKWLSCEIGLPRLAEQLHIDASDLQLVDARKPNLVKLTALVRNRARVPVEYPAFELTLTNAREQVVARRVFVPEEYLVGDVRKEEGLPGRQELSVNLYLDTGPLRAAGYRIYLFYPS